MAAAFEIKNLRKTYGPRAILNVAHAELPAGEIIALVGPNGCGKTTLLECLNGLAKPDGGEILFFGEPLKSASRKQMSLVFQSPYMFNSTVEQNVAYGLRARQGTDAAAVRTALETVRMSDFSKRRAKNLSGGEAKRVAIARALAISPRALLLDEPTANVDGENTAIIEETVRSLCRERGATVIIATHDREQAVRLADRVLLIHAGNLVPFHPDNHFSAILSQTGLEKLVTIGDNLRAVVSTPKMPGPVSCTIPPDEIIVSSAPLVSSARNCWSGPVTGITLDNGRVRVVVDAGAPVVATITRASFDSLQPTIGTTLYLTFKASSVLVF
ncbi:MAG: ATP-binding cassette domain-containing protein [bacterium]